MTPRPSRRAIGLTALAIAMALLIGACTISAGPTFPPAGSSPAPAGDATAVARAQVTAALTVEGLTVQDAKTAYRPPEGAIFAAAPRTVVQVVLPDDPNHGYIVLYAFGTPQQALAGAQDQAAYIASGPGRVQFVPGSQFSLRVVGNIAIFFAWVPDNSPDQRTPSIALALSQIGDEVPIPA
jgi:hypothetical protein